MHYVCITYTQTECDIYIYIINFYANTVFLVLYLYYMSLSSISGSDILRILRSAEILF